MLRADGTFSAALHHVFPDNSIEIETTEPLDPGGWHHLALTYDGSSRARGLRLFVDGQLADTRIVVDNLQRSILRSGDKKNEYVGRQPAAADWPAARRDAAGRVGRRAARLHRRLTAFEVAASGGRGGSDWRRRCAVPSRERTRRAARGARRVLHRARRARFAALSRALATLRGKENDDPHLAAGSDGDARAAGAAPDVRPRARRLRRAHRARHAGHAARHRRLPGELPQNRLGLARWLLSPRHPLTARVIVNRYWAMLFGRGLVATLGGLRQPGQAAVSPAAARLAGDDVRRIGVEPEGAAEADRAVGDVPAGFDGSTRSGWSRIRRTSGWRAGRRIDWRPSRFATARWPRAACWSAPSAGRASTPTSRQGCGKRSPRGTRRSTSRARRRPLSPQPLHRVEAILAAAVRDQLRRGRAAVLHRRSAAHEHAAPVAGAAERSAVRRSLARAGRADDLGKAARQPRDRITFAFRLLTSRRPDAEELELLDTLYADMRAEYGRDRRAALEAAVRRRVPSRSHARSRRCRGLHDRGDDDHEFRRGGLQEIMMPKLKLGPT